MSKSDFLRLNSVSPQIMLDMNYATSDNFVGHIIPGYEAKQAWMSKAAAEKIGEIQNYLLPQKMTLKIFDAYRPQMAVDFFLQWSQKPDDFKTKNRFYPNVDKKDLFELGYLAEESSHSRGSSVDLTIFDLSSDKELDMGTVIDFFDELSHTENPNLKSKQMENRKFLVETMKKFGFRNYRKEWWHFNLIGEPFPETYFNFPVTDS